MPKSYVTQKEREKIRIFKDMEQAKAETIARKKEQAARDKMDDRLIEVLNKSRARIERRRKQTELDVSIHAITKTFDFVIAWFSPFRIRPAAMPIAKKMGYYSTLRVL